MDKKKQVSGSPAARQSRSAVAAKPPGGASGARHAQSGQAARPAQSGQAARPAQSGQAARRRKKNGAGPDAGKRAKARRPAGTGRPTETVKKRAPKREPTPQVVYTPASPFHRGHFVLRLVTVLAVVVALVLGISIFFKVKNVTVAGAHKYTAWDVREASGIQDGDNLLTFGKPRACGKIKAALPYVKSVRIGIKLPDTVNIEIEEAPVVYSVADSGGGWWLITAEGRVAEKLEASLAGEYTRIRGVQLLEPTVGGQAQAAGPAISGSADPQTGESQTPTVSGSDRLSAALSILQNLEMNSMIGAVSEINVENILALSMQYGQQYDVQLGDITQLGYKITCLKRAVGQLEDYQCGTLDVSFAFRNEVIFTPAQ